MIMPGAEPFELGPEEARIGCVLIHGFTGSPAEMKPFARRLSAAGVRCYAPLLPGHGTSLDDMEASTAHQWLDGAEQAGRTAIGASAVAGAFHRPRHERLFVLGFSMGGLLTLNLSLNPDLAPHITGLVVVCTPLRIHDPRARFIPILGLFRRYEPTVPPPPLPPEEVAQRPVVSYAQKPVASIRQLMRLMSHTRRILPQVQAPLVAMYGALDRTAPANDGRELVARVSSNYRRLKILPASKHLAMFGPDSELLLDCVERFITS